MQAKIRQQANHQANQQLLECPRLLGITSTKSEDKFLEPAKQNGGNGSARLQIRNLQHRLEDQ